METQDDDTEMPFLIIKLFYYRELQFLSLSLFLSFSLSLDQFKLASFEVV